MNITELEYITIPTDEREQRNKLLRDLLFLGMGRDIYENIKVPSEDFNGTNADNDDYSRYHTPFDLTIDGENGISLHLVVVYTTYNRDELRLTLKGIDLTMTDSAYSLSFKPISMNPAQSSYLESSSDSFGDRSMRLINQSNDLEEFQKRFGTTDMVKAFMEYLMDFTNLEELE